MKDYLELSDVKTGKDSWHQIITNPTCLICMAEDKNGKDVRNIIDKYCITHSYQETLKFVKTFIFSPISLTKVKRHFENHSPYVAQVKEHIKGLAESTALERIEQLDEQLDPDEVISEIITIGGKKIKSGDIDIDAKLLLGALKEQGARKKFGSLRDVLEELDRVRFGKLPLKEGELLEDGSGQTTTDIQR